MKHFIFNIILLCGLVSCRSNQTSFDDINDFEVYINNVDNGFIQSTETKDLIIETKLVPALDTDSTKMWSIFLRIKSKTGHSVITMNGNSTEEINAITWYIENELLNDIYVTDNEADVYPVFHHYERNYGIKPSIDVFFEFPAFKPKSNVSFNFRDKIFGQGLITTTYNKELFTIYHVK